ncbi:hypothetical protein EDC17_10337 [Sphingobacterium alimentarium]|uniref:Uncharacterized protein n=1 Tax=Sphingobacterium alimentarium TaxID=797292 RepID=A0A4R3VWC4_9SPHI|nr:hypothetical protein EDC17_10337 [Sphingobacterium alimentarium]
MVLHLWVLLAKREKFQWNKAISGVAPVYSGVASAYSFQASHGCADGR